MYGQMEAYHPPEWAAGLSYIPKNRIPLAMTNTPIHPWKVPGVPADFSVSVKRDDLTGCALTGNKVRKLEFFMAEAVERKCRHVITCGAVQSNHCRAVALCARQLGMTPHLFLCADLAAGRKMGCEGNLLLDRLCGARLYLVPLDHHFNIYTMPRMRRLAQHIMTSSGDSSYVIPMGGSTRTGIFGAITVFEELRKQGVLEQYDDLVFPCGSGKGSAAGLAIANHLTGGHLRLHGYSVRGTDSYIYNHLEEGLQELGLGHLKARNLVRIVDGYQGRGYTLSTREELEFLHHVAVDTAVVLDPVYSGKTTLAMVTDMHSNPKAFQGRRVLYLHTGGIFGLFDGRMTPVLDEKEERQPSVTVWPEVDDFPFSRL